MEGVRISAEESALIAIHRDALDRAWLSQEEDFSWHGRRSDCHRHQELGIDKGAAATSQAVDSETWMAQKEEN